MNVQIVVPLFVVAAIIFLVVVYGVMKSPEQEERERQQKELEQEMREFFQRENEQGRD